MRCEQVAHAVVDGKGPLMLGGALVPGLVAKAEVDLLRRILYAYGGDGNIAITRAEAEVLFRINERQCCGRQRPVLERSVRQGDRQFRHVLGRLRGADARCGVAP